MTSKFVSKLGMALAFSGLCGLGACDQSKAELDATKAQLATVTADRDTLKGQLETMKTQLEAAKKEADEAKAKMAEMQAKAQAEPVAPPPEPEKDKGKTAKKTTTAKPAVPAPKNPAAPIGTKDNPTLAPSKGNQAF